MSGKECSKKKHSSAVSSSAVSSSKELGYEAHHSKVWGAWVLSVLGAGLLIFIMLITSVELVAYGDMGYYQKEYEKYEVAEDLQMEMPDIMEVTKEMMAFLRGDRENLIVETTVNKQPREFFNESEIAHMVDVQEIFVAGLQQRNMAILLVVGIAVILMWKYAKQWKRIFPQAFLGTTLVFVGVGALLGGLFALDFNRCFVIFHGIFFEADTWIFDPNVSLMINMLPEGLFYDMAIRIVVVFVIMLLGSGAIINYTYRKLKLY